MINFTRKIVQNAKVEANSIKERANLEIEREKEKAEYEIKKTSSRFSGRAFS